MTVRNMSPATQRSYVSAVSKFSRYFGRSLVCALRFFYGITLGQATVPERIPYAREPRKLPVVLSADEVVQFLEAVSSLKRARCSDDPLCGGASRLGGRRAQSRGCR